jgi:hypothetical protein
MVEDLTFWWAALERFDDRKVEQLKKLFDRPWKTVTFHSCSRVPCFAKHVAGDVSGHAIPKVVEAFLKTCLQLCAALAPEQQRN